jgi:hypothetical protein
MKLGLDDQGKGLDWMKIERNVLDGKGKKLDWMEKERKKIESNLNRGVIFWMVICGLLNPLFFVLISWGCLTGPIFFFFFAMSQFDWPIAKKKS